MPEVVEITHELLVKYCKARDLKYLTDEEGDLCITFPGQLNIWLIVSGAEDHIMSMLALLEGVDVPKDLYGQTLVACNEWNRDYRVPRAYLRLRDDLPARIQADAHVMARAGVHQELVNEFYDATMGGTFQFIDTLKRRAELAKVTGGLVGLEEMGD